MSKALIATNKGNITIELFDEAAPDTVANFTKLISNKYYNGLKFHRVIADFVIQGGCPNTRVGAKGTPGTGGPGWNIKCETKGNPHRHELGAMSMAHAGLNTGGSQFFIVNGDRRNVQHLDGVHTVFGKCADQESIAVVTKIAQDDEIISITLI